MNRDSDPINKWKSEVQRQTDEWTQDAKNAQTAWDQQEKINREQQDLLANDLNTGGLAVAATVGTAAMTSAGLAAAGFSWTGPGALVAAGLAGIGGGISAWLNRDQLTEVWARGNVMADAAVDQKYGRDTAFFQQLASKGQLAVKVISPFQNAVQGIADEAYGRAGDAKEDFYAVDETGARRAPGWLQGADVVAAFGDSMLQFTNPLGQWSYMAGTGASVLGQAGTGILSNAVYNDRTGQWDPLENKGETLSAIGAVGLDALSMGVGHGIYKSGVAGRAMFGKAGRAGEVAALESEGKRFGDVLINGRKVSFDAQGEVIKARASASLLLNPEEALKYVATSWQARRNVMARGEGALAAGGNRIKAFQPDTMTGRFVSEKAQERVNRLLGTHMPGPDDYYRAALEMAHNTRFADAVVNGWAEGVLEAATAIFQPLSVSEDINVRDVFVSYAYGMAAGMGMSTAARATGTSDAVIEEYRAKSLYMMRNKITELDEADWKDLWSKASKGEKKRMAIATAPEAQKISDMMDAYRQLSTRSAANSSVGLSVMNAARWGNFEQLHDNAIPRLNDTLKLVGLGPSGNTVEGVADSFDYRPNSGVMSAYQVVSTLEGIRRGFSLQIDAARDMIEHWKNIRDNADPSSRDHAHAVEQVTMYENDLATFDDQMKVSKEFADTFLMLYEAFRQEGDWAIGLSILAEMNEALSRAYEGRWEVKDDQGNMVVADARTQELVRRAVEMILYRPPAMDDSSAIMLRMQISPELTRRGEHAKVYLANMLLKAPNADHDGDQGIFMFNQYISPTARQHLRRGGQYLTPVDDTEQKVNDPNDPSYIPPMDNTPAKGKYAKSRMKVISDPQDGIKSFVDIISEATLDPMSDRAKLMDQHLNRFMAEMMARYSNGTGPIRTDDMLVLLDQFEKDLKTYGYKAQEKLLDGMFSLAHQELLLYSDKQNDGPEMLWVGWRVNLLVDNIQRGLARLAFAEQKPVIPGEAAQLPDEHAFNEGIAKRRAVQDGMTIAFLLDRTTSDVRQAQALHYSPFVAAAVESMNRDETGFIPDAVLAWEEQFNNLGSGVTKSEVERVQTKNAVENRVVEWLADISAAAKRQYPNNPRFQNLSEALVTLGMMRVQDVEVDAVGVWKTTGGEITLLQSLLKKSLWIEENRERTAREDSPERARIDRLKRLTKAEGTRSVTASKALIEVMGNQSWHRLVGEESDYMGGVVTPAQTVLGIQGLSDERREAQIDKWERLPNYFHSNRGMNPPYTAEYLMSGDVNAFTMLIDAVAAVARTDPRDMERRNQTTSNQWRGFHQDLKTMRENWREQHNDRIVKEWHAQGNTGEVSPEFVLRDMLARSAEASTLIGDIIPEASVRGIFSRLDGEVWTANWLEAMLLEEKAAKAEVMYFLFSKLAELNVMGGQLSMPKDWDKDDAGKRLKGQALTDAKKNAALVREGVAYDQIKSRFLRKVYVLAKDDPTGYELNRLLVLGMQANDVHEFLKAVDAEPNWGQGEKRLLAYFDDVAGFEVDPKDFWTNNLPSSLQREAITLASQRMSRLSTAHAEMAAEEVAETQVFKAMNDLIDARKNNASSIEPDSMLNANKNLEQMEKALTLAKMFPDAYGIRARLQMMELIQSGVIQTQDKGGPDVHAGPMGAPAATMDDFGFKSGLDQEFAWQNRHSWKDILTNPSKLVEGPVRIMFDDGRIFDADFSTVEGLVKMGLEPTMRPMIKAALFPVVRDIDDNNVSRAFQVHQPFSDQGGANIVQLLEEADLGHLFSSNGRLSLEQAERIIEMLDSGVRAMARTSNGAVQEMPDQPVQSGIHDLLVAYTHAPGGEVQDKEAQRVQLLIHAAEALVAASIAHENGTSELLKAETKAYLDSKYMNDRRGYDVLRMSDFDKDLLDQAWANANLAYFVGKGLDLVEQLKNLAADPNTTQQQKDDLQREIEKNTELVENMKANPLTTPPSLPPSLNGVVDMFVLGINDPDPNGIAGYARMTTLEYLFTNHAIDRFVEGDDYRLAQKVRDIVNGDVTQLTEDDPRYARIQPEEWETLAHWAAYIFVAEAGSSAASGTGLIAGKLGPEGEKVRRYYDHSWMYTTDMLFDPVVMKVMTTIRKSANYNPSGVSHMNVLDTFKRGVLSPKYLGQWTSAVVGESLKAQRVLQGASVLSAIQRHGVNPQTQRDYVGAGLVSFAEPKPEHMSTVTGPLPMDTGLDRLLSTVPLWFIKLENHFYKSVRILDKSGNLVADLSQVGDVVNYDVNENKESSTAKSGYRVFSTLQMNEELEKLRAANPALAGQDLVFEVEFVDVDKKPHTPEYVNSIYFDGVGPSRGTGIAPGVVADMIFGSFQINKKGQQDPLDFAARAGKAFMQGLTTPTDRTVQLENSGKSLTEIIGTKALRMWTKEYETGDMPWGSLTGLYKRMKMQHILRGTVNGKLTFMWSEEAITREATGQSLGFDNDEYQLVNLSDDVLITLLGRSGKQGTQALTMPQLNITDIDRFPSLDLDRMQELGLIHLGESADITSTPLAQMTNLPRQSMKLAREGDTKTSVYEEKILHWLGMTSEILGNRGYMSKTGTNFHVPTSNAEHLRQLEWMLSQENLAPLLARFGIPFADINDVDKLQMTKILMQMLQPVFERNANAMIWRFSMEMSPDPAAGVLAPMSLEKDFSSVSLNGQSIAPIYGDVVIFDLAELVAKNNNDPEAAIKQAKGFITKLSKRGVTVMLASSSGDQYVRSQLNRWLREGELGYRAVAGSAHAFAPRTRDPQVSVMAEAHESGLLETRYFDAEGLGLRAITDMFGGSEGTVLFDPDKAEHIVWERVSNTIVPGNIVATSAERQSRLFNLPEVGEGQRDYFAKAARTLRPLIETQEGREYMKKMLGGNPDGVQISHKHSKDGSTLIDPGVLDIDEAIDEFIQAIQAGTEIIKPGAVLRYGQLYHVINAQNEVVLIRHGFKLPKGDKLIKQFGDPIPDTTAPLKVAFSTGEPEDRQSITPPLRIDGIQNLGELGIQITGTYALDKMSKELSAALGYKAGLTPLPGNYQFHPTGMSNQVTISTVAGMKSIASKQSSNGTILNYRWAFALTGIDFRAPLVRFFFGDRNRTKEEFDEDWNKVARFLDEWSSMDWNMSPADIRAWLSMRGVFSMAGQQINSVMDKYTVGWTPVDFSKQVESYPQEPDARIAEVVLTTLMASEVKPQHILGTRGLLTTPRGSTGQIALMPPLFTEALGDPHFPEVHEMLLNQINSHMPKDSVGRPLYELTPDWKFRIRMVNKNNKDPFGNPTDDDMLIDAYLQIYMGIPSEANSAALNVTNNRGKADVSAHLAATFGETLQSWTAVQPSDKVSKLDSLLGGQDQILRFDDTDNAVFWDLFRRMKKVDETYSKWTNRRLPLQQAWIRDAEAKRKGYEVILDKEGWDQEKYNVAVDKFFKVLNLQLLPGNNRYEVDFLVRQFLGRPNDKDNIEIGKISEADFHEVVTLMTENVSAPKFLHPLHGGMVPMESESFWSKVYQAQATAAKPWQPMSGKNWRGKKDFANSWDEWVSTLLGQVNRSNQEFLGMFRKDLDGFWHTYQGTTPTFAHITLSLDARINMGLMDSEMNEYILSLDPSQNAMWKDPVILEIMGNTLDTLTGHPGNVVRLEDARTAPVAEYSDQLKRIKAWLKGNNMGTPKDKSIASYFREGEYYQETTRQQSALWANLNNLQLLNRLFNPEIAMSSVIELPMRNAMEHVTNLVMGTYTGKGDRLFGRGVEGKADIEGWKGAVAKVRENWGAQFTTDELRMLNDLAETLAGSTKWRAEIFGEIMYKAGVLKGSPGARSRKLERIAAVVAKGVSDPTIGMLPKSMARRYLNAAWEYMVDVDQNITVEQFVKEMKENTLWLKENSPAGRMNGHKAGVNRIAQARSAKQSTLSKTAFKGIDKLSSSSSNMAQFGAFLFNVPFYFRRFNINSALSLTGLTGFDQVAAMMLDARPTNSIIGRIQAGMRGDTEGYIPTEYTDYSDVLEGVDLTRPFVRGAITQTGLMLAGIMAGNLSLDGEDDEAKKRRRMAQYLNVPLYLDPLRAENDYLYADALFLDSIDPLAGIFKDPETGRSAVLPPWYLRQFTSPMMGVQRFFNTGDLREVFWGFQDAASVIPYSAMNIWREARETADVLAGESAENVEEGDGNPETRAKTASNLVTIASVFEKALLENAFVNGIRNSSDEFDRDPWKYAATADENTGELDRLQGTGNTQQSTATGDYVDPETGEVKTAYLTRPDNWSLQGANAHAYAENNATAATLMSLFTGQIFSPGSNSYLRKNMVIKERAVDLPDVTPQAAKAYILAAYHGMGGQRTMTEQELIGMLKFQDEQAGRRWNQADIEKRAATILAAHDGEMAGMSMFDDVNGEVITTPGAKAVIDGLWSGTVDFESASLQGVWIPYEMREELQSIMIQELITEGVNKGMSHESAYWYAKRVWEGDKTDPDAPGMGDLLWSDEIPYSGKVKYNQLNTTYMIGPNGQPVATPFQRKSVLAVLGIPLPTVTHGATMGMTKDELGKSVDEVLGINTGLHGLARKQNKEKVERPKFPDLAATDGTPGKIYPFRRYGRSRGGGGGGYDNFARPYFQRMQPLPSGTSARLFGPQAINVTNPQIRRARVNRERISSERGRLKQWQ